MIKPKNFSKDTSAWITCVPQALHEELVSWFHDSLNHAEVDGIYNILIQHFCWQGMKPQIAEYVNSCPACQKFKITAQNKYGLFPLKSQSDKLIPWNTIYVDKIGP